MKKERIILFAVGALILVTAAAAAVHLTGRIAPAEGSVYIEQGERSTEVAVSELALGPVQGTLVNGKGETRTVDGQGILLSALLEKAEMTAEAQVTVTADDEYSAVVTAEELSAADKVYLMLQEEDGVQLVVFGDSNSKRNVSNVTRVSVE